MVSSSASTVKEYLQELAPDRREVISRVRQVILDNLPEGYQETMNWGMISYEIPLERYPVTYNKKPLSYIGLAAQKHNYSLYLMGVYQDPEQEALLVDGFQQAGKRLDMGKSCVRFRRLDDLPLDVIAEIVSAISVEQYIERYERSRKK